MNGGVVTETGNEHDHNYVNDMTDVVSCYYMDIGHFFNYMFTSFPLLCSVIIGTPGSDHLPPHFPASSNPSIPRSRSGVCGGCCVPTAGCDGADTAEVPAGQSCEDVCVHVVGRKRVVLG